MFLFWAMQLLRGLVASIDMLGAEVVEVFLTLQGLARIRRIGPMHRDRCALARQLNEGIAGQMVYT